jgi:hypothetical protein
MKKQFAFIALFAALVLPHFAHAQIRLSISDQKRFDSYYSRWQSYRATNNQSEVRSMEGRMQDVYRHYGIPANTPYSRVASGGGGVWNNGGWNGAPAPQPTGTARPYWGQDGYRDHDRDWDRDHHWDRDRARDEHREWERHREWEHRRWEREREEARHDNGLHRGWYKDHGNNPHNPDRDRDHHDRDDHRDHRDHDRHDHDNHDHKDQIRPH